MCPACLGSILLAAAGAISAGGVTGLVVNRLRAGSVTKKVSTQTKSKENSP